MADTPNGVYVAHLGGGQVNTATGDFVFGMTEAYLIEDGKITEPLREGNLIGNGPKVLEMIDAVGNDFEMGPPGTCGKDGQGVPVGDGVPTLRVTSAHRRRDGGLMMPRSCWRSATGSSPWPRAASRSRWWWAGRRPPRCGSTRATSSSWPRPPRRASACG